MLAAGSRNAAFTNRSLSCVCTSLAEERAFPPPLRRSPLSLTGEGMLWLSQSSRSQGQAPTRAAAPALPHPSAPRQLAPTPRFAVPGRVLLEFVFPALLWGQAAPTPFRCSQSTLPAHVPLKTSLRPAGTTGVCLVPPPAALCLPSALGFGDHTPTGWITRVSSSSSPARCG